MINNTGSWGCSFCYSHYFYEPKLTIELQMLDRLKEKLENLFIEEREELIIPFDDPMAHQISWKPLEKGGSTMRTHVLKTVGYNRMELRSSLAIQWTAFTIVLSGMGMLGFYLFAEQFGIPWDETDGGLFFLIMGIIFCVFGLAMLIVSFRKKVFDKQTGYYWKGWSSSPLILHVEENNRIAPLNQIYALQIIKKRVKETEDNYISYELNLVLKDLPRINVMDHSKLDKLKEDAESLAQFLNVPVWDIADMDFVSSTSYE